MTNSGDLNHDFGIDHDDDLSVESEPHFNVSLIAPSAHPSHLVQKLMEDPRVLNIRMISHNPVDTLDLKDCHLLCDATPEGPE